MFFGGQREHFRRPAAAVGNHLFSDWVFSRPCRVGYSRCGWGADFRQLDDVSGQKGIREQVLLHDSRNIKHSNVPAAARCVLERSGNRPGFLFLANVSNHYRTQTAG